MKWWPSRVPADHGVSPETKAVQRRTENLLDRVEELGKETRAVRYKAEQVRRLNHFGPALIAAFTAPRKDHR